MATHSSILAWRIPWTEEPGGHSPWGRKESDTTEQLYNKNAPKKRTHGDFPGGPAVNALPASAGGTGSTPGLGRSHPPQSNQPRVPPLLSLHAGAHGPRQEKPQEAHAPQQRAGPALRN